MFISKILDVLISLKLINLNESHSYEMLKSFSKASEMNEDAGAYFEITKDVRTDQFVAVKRTPDIKVFKV
jgi:hypothetical protein